MSRTSRVVAGALGLAALLVPSVVWAEDPPPPIAIVHGKVYLPGGKAPLDDGTVVIDKGRIVSVGKDVAAPPSARVIDAHGKVVTPGLIDTVSDVGVVDVDVEGPSNDIEAFGLLTPGLRMADAYNPRTMLAPITRTGGVTSVVVPPGDAILGGQSAFADLVGEDEGDAMVRPTLAQNARLDDDAAEWFANSRGGLWLLLRAALEEARFYATHKAQYDSNAARPLHLTRADLEALQPLLKGEQPLVAEIHRASDIETALRFADEEKIKLVIEGGSEAWVVAEHLAKRKVPVVLDPIENLPAHFDRLHSRSDNAALLARAGVTVVIATFSNRSYGDTSHNSRDLWQLAGNAVRMGMEHDDAIRAVTENPAAAFGIKGYGRLEAGAVANVVVWSGDPLQIGTRVEQVLVHGRLQSLETRQTLLLDRYRTLPLTHDGSR